MSAVEGRAFGRGLSISGERSGFGFCVAFFGGVERILRLGHADGIKDFGDLFVADELLLARDGDDGFAGSDGLLYDLRRLGVSDVGVKGGGERNGALRVEVATLRVGGDARDAAVVELTQHVRKDGGAMEDVVGHRGHHYVELELTGLSGVSDGSVVAD